MPGSYKITKTFVLVKILPFSADLESKLAKPRRTAKIQNN